MRCPTDRIPPDPGSGKCNNPRIRANLGGVALGWRRSPRETGAVAYCGRRIRPDPALGNRTTDQIWPDLMAGVRRTWRNGAALSRMGQPNGAITPIGGAIRSPYLLRPVSQKARCSNPEPPGRSLDNGPQFGFSNGNRTPETHYAGPFLTGTSYQARQSETKSASG